jgi:hypothetical protein
VPNKDTLTITNETIKFKKNKLTDAYVSIPLMLHFNSQPHGSNSFNIAVGGYAGILLDSYTKQISDERGKQRIHDDYSLNPYRYGLTAQIGYDWFNLYANYDLSNTFQQDKGPDATTLSFGIIVSRFKW